MPATSPLPPVIHQPEPPGSSLGADAWLQFFRLFKTDCRLLPSFLLPSAAAPAWSGDGRLARRATPPPGMMRHRLPSSQIIFSTLKLLAAARQAGLGGGVIVIVGRLEWDIIEGFQPPTCLPSL